MSQDQLKIQHALSRLELAKAIKTPEPGAIDAEPWSKSIIFNQPFIKQLLQQKEQLMKRRDVRTKPKLQNRRKSHSSLNLEPKMSKLSMKRSMTETAIAPPACLPSDSEEEESDSSEEEEEEDSDSDSDENDDSELFQAAPPRQQQKLVSRQQRAVSIESVQDGGASTPSRSSSINCPLTDEEEPMSPPTHRRMTSQEQSTNEQYTNNKPAMEMMDPMYYQRMQQYQLQLQYQTQLQYQQAMMYQQQQYLRAQTPMVYLPSVSPPPRDASKRRHMPVSNTDMRRRAEMLRNAAEFSSNTSTAYYTLPLQAPVMRNYMNSRPNYHPI